MDSNVQAGTSTLEIVVDVVSAYVSRNAVPVGEVPNLIGMVYQSFNSLVSPAEPAAEEKKPAISIKKSVTPDYIVCLEDGKKFKSLRRHLSTSFGMTPDEYRAKWKLPADYPMVAPNYSEQRSALAKKVGLGRKPDQKPVRTKAAATKTSTGKSSASKRKVAA